MQLSGRWHLNSDRPGVCFGECLRSGTSLTEQILTSHPSIFGAGEMDFWNALTRTRESVLRKESAGCGCPRQTRRGLPEATADSSQKRATAFACHRQDAGQLRLHRNHLLRISECAIHLHGSGIPSMCACCLPIFSSFWRHELSRWICSTSRTISHRALSSGSSTTGNPYCPRRAFSSCRTAKFRGPEPRGMDTKAARFHRTRLERSLPVNDFAL